MDSTNLLLYGTCNLQSDAYMILNIFQTFSEQLFIRQVWTATLIYKLPYFEKQVFLKASKSSQETPMLESLFNKIAGSRTATVLKKRLLTKVFCCEFYETFKNASCFCILKISVPVAEFTSAID